MDSLTKRDREYLRMIYLLQGYQHEIGPGRLSEIMGISRVCAFQKMHRLGALGFGTYEIHKGLKLNDKAINIVEYDMKRHHIIESYLQENFGLSHHQACTEAEILSDSISNTLFKRISQNTIGNRTSCCKYVSYNKLTPEIMKTCSWIKKSIKNNEKERIINEKTE